MSGREKQTSFLSQGIILAAASVVVRLIGLVYRIPLAKTIGNDGLGAYSNAYEVYSIALLLSTYSIPTAISKLISEREDKKEYGNSYHMLQVGLIFATVLGFLASLLLFLGADFIALYVFKEADLSTAIPLKVLAPTIFVFSIIGVIRGFFQGKHTVIPTTVSQILEQIVNAVVSVVAAKLLISHFSASPKISAYGAAGGTLGTLCGALVALVFLLIIFFAYFPYLKRRLRKDRIGAYEDRAFLLKMLLLTTVPIILNQTVYSISSLLDSVLLNQIFDYKGIGETVRRELFGLYSGKYRLMTNVPIAIASSIGMATLPSVVQAFTLKNKELLHGRIAQAIKLNMLIAFPCAAGMAVLAGPIMQFVFGDTGESLQITSRMMYIGAASIIFFAYSTATNSILQGVNKMRVPVLHGVLSLAFYLVLDVVLLLFTPLGVYSLVVGNMVFPLVISVLNWLTLKKDVGYVQELDKTFIRIGICTAFMAVLALLTYRGMLFLSKSNGISLCVAIFIAILVYFVLLFLFRAVNEEELSDMPKGTVLVKLAKKFHLM
ncbi:MAG: polysaccharide biosynthesis protein [Lachnospiraceae bacterium]|nr:polysaccharide biosynthesis protein [Lachnospiraceae bacterium]